MMHVVEVKPVPSQVAKDPDRVPWEVVPAMVAGSFHGCKREKECGFSVRKASRTLADVGAHGVEIEAFEGMIV